MGEEPEVIGSNIDRIFHVHIADHPGRNEPGSGNLNLRERLRALSEQGYHGFVGLEFKPLCPTTMAVAQSKSLLEGWEH
jgi:hydroxypyruvate isomerase